MLTRNRERLIGYHVIESRQWCLCEPCHDVFIFSQLGPLCGPLESYKSVLLPQLWHQATPSRSPWNRKGTEIETDIFVGVVYYQRLRHLVMDKAQVRARGSLDERRQRGNNSVAKGRKVEVICRLQILNDFEETRIKESSIHVFFFWISTHTQSVEVVLTWIFSPSSGEISQFMIAWPMSTGMWGWINATEAVKSC